MHEDGACELDSLIGVEVVLDLNSEFVVLGRLERRGRDFLVLMDVDVHDLRDAQTTREKYIVDCREHGVRPNRKRVWVSLREVVGVSRLEDVIPD